MLKVKCLKHQKEKKGCYTAYKSDATVARNTGESMRATIN